MNNAKNGNVFAFHLINDHILTCRETPKTETEVLITRTPCIWKVGQKNKTLGDRLNESVWSHLVPICMELPASSGGFLDNLFVRPAGISEARSRDEVSTRMIDTMSLLKESPFTTILR